MAKISTYANDSAISSADKVIGSNAENANATVNFTMGGITSFVYNQTIAQTTSTILSQVVSNPTLGTITNHVLGQVVIAPTVETISDYVYNDQIGNITTHVLGEVVEAPTIETISDYVYTDQIGNITTHVLGQIPPVVTQVLSSVPVLYSTSFETQSPTGTGFVNKKNVKFSTGSVQNPSNAAMIGIDGSTITINQTGVYILSVTLRIGKFQGDSNNHSNVMIRSVIGPSENQLAPADSIILTDAHQTFLYNKTDVIGLPVGTHVIKFQILRAASSNANAGSLIPYFDGDGDFGNVPSATIFIWKLSV